MDILSYNRAVLAGSRVNEFVESGAGFKVLLFVLPKVMNEGEQNIAIQFPFSGTITEVTALCSIPSTSGDTKIDIERCSAEQFPEGWESILTHPLTIGEGESVSSDANVELLTDASVNAHDYFRVVIPELGEGAEGFTIQMVVKIFE